jgi:transposase, IS30 family
MKHYTQLTEPERNQIYALKQAGFKPSAIALQLSRHPSTICRELRRNRGLRGYRPWQAQQMADTRRREKAKPKIPEAIYYIVNDLIEKDWSPEQISGWLAAEKNVRISHERIYQHIARDRKRGGSLHLHLRCRKKRKKRYGSADRRGQIRNRTSIDNRPDVVEERSRIGDWEADTVIGRRGGSVLVTLVERKSRFSVIALAPDKRADSVTQALAGALLPYQEQVHTITCDNGKEFAFHQEFSTVLQAECFFAHPYQAWERGLNENTNGLIRQYLPKGTDFDTLSQQDINCIAEKINNRPRKSLGFNTPKKLFLEACQKVALGT